MKKVLILFVFLGLSLLAAMPSEAHNANIGVDKITLAPLSAASMQRAADISTFMVWEDTPSLQDTTELEDSVDNDWSSQLSSQFGDIGSMVLDQLTTFLTGTVEPWVTGQLSSYVSDAGGDVEGGLSSLGGDITTGWDDFTSLFGTRRRIGSASTLSTSDSTLVEKNGVFTTGFLIGTSIGLWNSSVGTHGASIFEDPTLGQNTSYTIPDPGASSANFVLDAGNQTIGGSKSFANDLTVGAHILSTSMAGFPSKDGTVVTSASVAGSDVAGTITLSTSTTPGEGTVTVPFATHYGSAPVVVITPASLNAQQGGNIIGYYVTSTTTNFTLNVKDTATTGTSSAQYYYMVMH